MDVAYRSLPHPKRLSITVLLLAAIVLPLVAGWGMVSETLPVQVQMACFLSATGLFVLAFLLTHRWTPANR